MWLVSVLMSQIQGIGTKLAIYGGVAVVLLIAQVLSQQGEQRREREALAQAEANERRAEERKRQRELDAELAVEEAAEAEAAETAAAEARHQDVREALLARYEELSAVVPARWRDDVMAAGATGKPGEVPPMIRMTPVQRGMWQVTNLIDKPVCVRITRVIEEDGRRQRCPLDAETQCREIGRKASRRILLYENPSVPACAHGQLEFRVGTAASPEPSWWTRTALEDFDPAAVVDDLRYRKYSIDHLRGEIALFEAMLADRQRATRWRNEWGGPEG
jgi:hypothetical protein